mgnify:CR=1 FL=1
MSSYYSLSVIRERIRRHKEQTYYGHTINNDKPPIYIVITKEHQKKSKQYKRVAIYAKNGLKKLQQLGF